MKTTIKIQETGNKKFKQVLIIVVATVIGFALTNSAVSSQNRWKEPGTGTTTKKVQMVTSHTNEDTTILASANSVFTAHSKISAPTFSTLIIEPVKEESLEIEGWMTDSNYFGQVTSYPIEKDQPLELEDWMISDLNFSSPSIEFIAEVEKEIEIENWMTDENFWRN